jgi:hypothetical protein
MEQEIAVSRMGNQVVLEGMSLRGDNLSVGYHDQKRCMITAEQILDAPSVYGMTPVKHFISLLSSLCDQKWSGVVAVDAGESTQKIYFRNGRLCFAGSFLMDHRLGEVLYRQGKLDLEQLINFAGLVNREKKFGQILIECGVIKMVDLWRALQYQVIDIVKYALSRKYLYYEMQEGVGLASTEVGFEKNSKEIIASLAGQAAVIRVFSELLTPDCEVKIRNSNDYKTGNFIGDFAQLVVEAKTSEATFEASKLDRISTMVVMINLMQQGILFLDKVTVPKINKNPHYYLYYRHVELYMKVVQLVKQKFDDSSIAFPIGDVRQFLAQNYESIALFVDEAGTIPPYGLYFLHKQSEANDESFQHVLIALGALSDFMIQLTMDTIGFKAAKEIRAEIMSHADC